MSDYHLKGAEKELIESIQTSKEIELINIGKCIGDEDDNILTLIVNRNGKNLPLVLLHGFTSGIGLWCLNFDALAKDRPVYAIDLLGFGSSSRPCFSSNAKDAEQQTVEFIEAWRKKVGLDTDFVLLGHSMGAFIAAAYVQYLSGKCVPFVHLTPLARSTHFPERPFNPQGIAFKMLRPSYFNPLGFMRKCGPVIGPKLVKRVRTDINHLYGKAFTDSIIAQYIYDCNAKPPTGEHCFYAMMDSYRWAKYPMKERICELRNNVALTFIYGQLSWVDRNPAEFIKAKRVESSVDIHTIEGAHHHIYAENPVVFHAHVLAACQLADNSTSKSAKTTMDN